MSIFFDLVDAIPLLPVFLYDMFAVLQKNNDG
jgi:hypothetical protein